MTDKKPKLDEDLIERIAQRLFDSYAKDWPGDHDARLWDEIDEEEAREWREEARELLTPAYEQGKLAGLEIAMGMVRLASGKEIRSSEASEAVQTYRELLFERLKSQIKEGEKR